MSDKTKKKTSKPKTIGVWMIIMVIFISELLFYAWCRVQYVRVGYEISGASHHHEELLTLQSSLRVELASLKSPDRIEKIAKKQLGLVTPAPEQMIIIP